MRVRRVVGKALGLGLAAALCIGASTASAATLSFSCLAFGAANCATGEAQASVDVIDYGGGQVLFSFYNTGPAISSLSDVYFDDGTLLGISDILNGPGVQFAMFALPNNLPYANNASPPFELTAGFSADYDSPAENAVQDGETVGILFSLQGAGTYQDVLEELADGRLRIGIIMNAFPDGVNISLINNPYVPVPEPATLGLFGIGLAALSLARARRS